MPDDFNPLDAMRAVAAATPSPGTAEFGLGTRALPVTSSDDAPVAVRLRGATLRPATPGAVLMDIVTLEETMAVDEWRRFRMRVGRLLGYVAPRGDLDDLE
jgi:hypothetical protein